MKRHVIIEFSLLKNKKENGLDVTRVQLAS